MYWFDDTGSGGCRVPQSWTLLYRNGQSWKPVNDPSLYGTKKDMWNVTTFQPVVTDALRMDVQLQKGFFGRTSGVASVGRGSHP